MIREETFARFGSGIERLRRLRVVPLVVLAGLAIIGVAVVRHLSPERKTLVFDLGIGVVFATGLYAAARRMIAAEAAHHHRALAAILIGVTTAAAALGILAVTLAGKPLGAAQLPGLVVIQLLGAIGGAAMGFLVGIFAAGVVSVVRRFFARPLPTIDGAWIGAMSGLVGSLACTPLPHLGAWFVATSTIACAVCGYRAARLHEELTP